MTKPLIGISTLELANEDWDPRLNGCRISYIQSIEAAGGIPVLIPNCLKTETLRHLYDRVQGILLVGGVDICPSYYGESAHEKLGATSKARDETELNIAKWAYDERKPLLGICRGLQVMNVALGGTLFQDLPAQSSSSIHSTKNEEWEELPHSLKIKEQSLFHLLLGCTEIQSNSLHHQGIKDLAPRLTATAWAPDELVEGIEIKDHPFYLGTQNHPEVLWQKIDVRWLELFKALIKAA